MRIPFGYQFVMCWSILYWHITVLAILWQSFGRCLSLLRRFCLFFGSYSAFFFGYSLFVQHILTNKIKMQGKRHAHTTTLNICSAPISLYKLVAYISWNFLLFGAHTLHLCAFRSAAFLLLCLPVSIVQLLLLFVCFLLNSMCQSAEFNDAEYRLAQLIQIRLINSIVCNRLISDSDTNSTRTNHWM